MTVAVALLLASHTFLSHDMLDMATHYDSRWDVSIDLRVDPAGATIFHVVGTVATKGVELTPGSGARTVMPDHTTRIDETWTGRATLGPNAVIVHFDDHADHGVSSAVDVAWRCDLAPTPVAGTVTAVWKCATPQTTTSPTGPGIVLPDYFRVPAYVAAPSVSLRVDGVARGGADHRSSMTSVSFSR